MVAKDDNGKPTNVPGLHLSDEESVRRFAEGKALKNLSKQKSKLLKVDFHSKTIVDLLSDLSSERIEVTL
jgi:hypothetical protein